MTFVKTSKLKQLAVLFIATSAVATPIYSAAPKASEKAANSTTSANPATTTSSSASSAATTATSTAAPDISGVYICNGNDTTDRDGQYTVELTVTKSGDAYTYKGMEKGLDNKSETFLGTGLFAKNSNNVLASTFWQENDPTKSGVVIHQIQPDGTWNGVWTWRDKVGVNTETCRKK